MRSRRAWARRVVAVAACTLALWTAAPARAADEGAAIPEPRGYVNDGAGIIGQPRAAQLESYLDQLHEKTGVQFAVLTVPTTAPEAPEQYKVRVFQKWGIGGAKQDEGLLLLVATQEHRIVFETGYGLEGTLPDGWQARMLRDLAVPLFRQDRQADGVTAAVLAASQRIAAEKGVTLEWTGDKLEYDEGPRSERLPLWAVALIVFFVVSMMVMRARFGGPGGRYYGGGGPFFGGWGGGFGGGGGGGGFGGFGGGGSGGGGGGASW